MKISFDGIACYNVELDLGKSPLSDVYGRLILETNSQPDYYARANFPPNKHQSNWRLFLIVNNHVDCFQDIVLRKSAELRDVFGEKVEIMPGQITINKETNLCIRINTEDTSIIPKVIDELKKVNISFLPNKKRDNVTARVFFKRYTQFVEIEDGVYRDSVIHGRYFFKIDKLNDWEEFQAGIVKIKNSCNFHLFDSFLTFMFHQGKGHDFIGIYSDHCDENRFPELKKFIQMTF
ncbi:MAG: hypothetical protein JXR60_05670 [Bacteroidales bacterium]|nr:hypothetical protein [Bacteroidales bacterium]